MGYTHILRMYKNPEVEIKQLELKQSNLKLKVRLVKVIYFILVHTGLFVMLWGIYRNWFLWFSVKTYVRGLFTYIGL